MDPQDQTNSYQPNLQSSPQAFPEQYSEMQSVQPQDQPQISPKIKKICGILSISYAVLSVAYVLLRRTIDSWLVSYFRSGIEITDFTSTIGSLKQATESAANVESAIVFCIQLLFIIPLIISIVHAKKNGVRYFKNPTKSKFRVASSLLACIVIVGIAFGFHSNPINVIFALVAGILFFLK